MNNKYQNAHEKILNNWKVFPYKLDYILGLLYSQDENISDICLSGENNVYIVTNIRSLDAIKSLHEYANLTITKEELYGYLGISPTNSTWDFMYKTQIFIDEYVFRGSGIPTINGEIIALRFLNTNDNVNFNQFNNKLENYCLIQDLEKNLSHKKSPTEKKLKV